MMGLMLARRWEKRFLVSNALDGQDLRLEIFVTLDIVQKGLWIGPIFFFSDFVTNAPKYMLENI